VLIILLSLAMEIHSLVCFFSKERGYFITFWKKQTARKAVVQFNYEKYLYGVVGLDWGEASSSNFLDVGSVKYVSVKFDFVL